MSTIPKRRNLLKRFLQDERGASHVIEIIGVAAIVILALVFLGPWLMDLITGAAGGIQIPNL